MNKRAWKERILAALGDMADVEFQRRAWTGAGPEVSSLTEVICRLFDDALLHEYVEEYRTTLSHKILLYARQLECKIRVLDTDQLEKLSVIEIIDSLAWIEITEIAVKLKSAFENDLIHE